MNKAIQSTGPVAVHSDHFYWQQQRLGYERYGESGTPCLLVHGILLDSHVNRALAMRFAAEGCQVVLLDLLGHGRSDKSADPADHRIDFYAEQMCAALDHLGWDRALVGGLSLGAISALQFAAIAPERLRGLFLEMPVMEQSTPAAALMLVPAMLATRYGAGVYRRFARLLRRVPRPRSHWLTSVLNAASQEPEVISAILHGVFVGPVVPPRAQREAITVPTLVIGHGGDILHELRDAEALAQQIPGASLLRARSILELRTRPERLWPEIRNFLQTLQVETKAIAKPAARSVKKSSSKSTARSAATTRKRKSVR